jgi:excisionase family DNA binding protein
MVNKTSGQIQVLDKGKLKDIEELLSDTDYLDCVIILANALKAERAARIGVETLLKEIVSQKDAKPVENRSDSKNKSINRNSYKNTIQNDTIMANQNAKMYSPEEVAQKLGVSRKTIHRRIQDGSIIAVRLSPKMLKIPESEVKRFILERQAL